MRTASIAIIDYGMGNLHSVASALRHVSPDSQVHITADQSTIMAADRVLFPGVGAMRDCMAEIRRLEIDRLLPNLLAAGKPVLAICVGMQALMQASEENQGVTCLGLLPGSVRFFSDTCLYPTPPPVGERLKVPHMGWNRVQQTMQHPLWQSIDQGAHFYFVHSYFADGVPSDPHVAGTCHYGRQFVAALSHNNLFATQFHPEKSQDAGLQLLKNFVHWDGRC